MKRFTNIRSNETNHVLRNCISVSPGISFWGVKRTGCECNGSPPACAKVKNVWSYTSNPPIRLHGVDGENITLHIVLIVLHTWIHRLAC